MKLFITLVVLLLLMIIGLSLGAENDTLVTINYLIAQGSFSLPAVLAVTFVAGVLIGLLLLISLYMGLRLRHSQLVRRYRKLKRQLPKVIASS